jgi:tetratricopeptide (TPR) repeat protein
MGRRHLLALLIVLGSFPAWAAAPSWTEIRSQHFVVMTDAGENQGREVAQRFEQMRGIFALIFHKSKAKLPVPLQIVAFRSQDGFIRYVPQWKGKPVSLTGFYQHAEDRDFIGIDLSSSDPYGTVFHEYAHLLLRGNFPLMPLWFDEGFAEYFSTLKVTNKEFELSGVPENFPAILNNTKWMPIVALFAAQRNSDAYNENDRRSIFYAESWLAVHYLLSNDRVLDAAKYLQLTQIQNVPVQDAIQQAFGVDAPTFEKLLRQHLNASLTGTRAPLPELNDEPYRSTKMSDVNAKAILADMHAHSVDHHQQALGEFNEVLAKDPNNALANRGLGYLYIRDEKFDGAAAAFQKALAADPNDAQLHYLVAYLMSRKAMKEGRPPDNVLAMRRELEAALQLDPNLADAHNLLAFALAADRKYDMAIQEQKKAIELNPSAEIYQANLSHIYLQAERWDDAEAIMTRLESSSDSEVRDNAVKNLAALKANRDAAAEQKRARAMGVTDPTSPQWKMPEGGLNKDANATDDSDKPDTRKVLYAYGLLESVDCSADPVAVLKVRKGPKLMKLRTDNYKKLLVMGADDFSCDWRNQKVLVNYKPGGKSDGDLVTLELEAGK